MKIFLDDSFDSAHFLPNVPDGHKCKNLHGHTYRIRLEIGGRLGMKSGWILDYSDIKTAWNQVKVDVDHKLLNDIAGLENSTCELLSVWIWDRLIHLLPGLVRIELRETEKCGCVYEGSL